MHKPKIVIVEDEFFAADHLGDLIEDLGFSRHSVYHSGEAFIAKNDWDFDAVLLDIFLAKKLTGLDVALELKKRNKPFVFITANQDRRTLMDAAKLGPEAYLSKPFNSNDVAAALEKIRYRLTSTIKLRGGTSIDNVHPSDILFIKSDGAYIEIFTREKKMVQRRLLHEFLEDLPDNFKRIHRSYVVNLKCIDQRTSQEVKIGEQRIPISRKYKDSLDS